MNRKARLVNKILIELDRGTEVIENWKFRYNITVQGIEAYNGNKSIIEPQILNENFEKVAGRLLEKLGY